MLPHAVRASLYIGGVRIREPKELNMKRLLGLLLVMGMGGCGGSVDASKLVNRDGLMYEGDSETPFTGVAVDEWRRGKKWFNSPYKDGKPEGLTTVWHPNGEKASELTYKDGKEVSKTEWDEEGNEIKE